MCELKRRELKGENMGPRSGCDQLKCPGLINYASNDSSP